MIEIRKCNYNLILKIVYCCQARDGNLEDLFSHENWE